MNQLWSDVVTAGQVHLNRQAFVHGQEITQFGWNFGWQVYESGIDAH